MATELISLFKNKVEIPPSDPCNSLDDRPSAFRHGIEISEFRLCFEGWQSSGLRLSFGLLWGDFSVARLRN